MISLRERYAQHRAKIDASYHHACDQLMREANALSSIHAKDVICTAEKHHRFMEKEHM